MIRKYDLTKDRPAVDELMVRLQEHFANIDKTKESLPFKDIESANKYMTKMIDDSDSMGGVVLVAEDENEDVIGFVQGVIIDHKHGDDIVFDTTHNERRDGWIGLLYVNENQRGKGIGKALMDSIQEFFVDNGCDTIRLLVLHDNVKTIEIYKKYGFIYHDVEMVKEAK